MHARLQALMRRCQQAMEAGELGIWDLRLDLDIVHHSPQWKLRLGFPEVHVADSTHFWRCRVHPDDLEDMLAAMRTHVVGQTPGYEARFRLRSNGSGYRHIQSRGLVVARCAEGRALRLVGTMLDLTERPATPQAGLPDLSSTPKGTEPALLPFHRLLSASTPESAPLLAQAESLLEASLAQLIKLQAAR